MQLVLTDTSNVPRPTGELCSVECLVTPERGCGTPWQYSWCYRKCSARMQSWHLCAPCLIGITRALIRFLRSKNTGGIPPSPIHYRRDLFAPVTSPRWQGLFMGLRFRFNVYSSNAATVAKTNFVMASHSLARGFFAVHVQLCHEQQ